MYLFIFTPKIAVYIINGVAKLHKWSIKILILVGKASIERINNLQVNWLLKSLKDFVRSDAMNSTQCEDPPECVSLDINRIKKREKLISILENENVPAEPDKWKQLI